MGSGQRGGPAGGLLHLVVIKECSLREPAGLFVKSSNSIPYVTAIK